jgi:hypothetical protein
MVNKPTLTEALAVPKVSHVVGETNGTYTAYMSGEELPAHAIVESDPNADV